MAELTETVSEVLQVHFLMTPKPQKCDHKQGGENLHSPSYTLKMDDYIILEIMGKQPHRDQIMMSYGL